MSIHTNYFIYPIATRAREFIAPVIGVSMHQLAMLLMGLLQNPSGKLCDI